MNPPPPLPVVNTYLEQLTVIRGDGSHLVPKERVGDHVVSSLCSLLLHALMLFVFSLSMFRAPAMVVTSDPASLWLIPFIAAGDIISESELLPRQPPVAAEEAAALTHTRVVALPAVATPPPAEKTADAIADVAEKPDAELVVLKQHKRPQPVLRQQPPPKSAAVADRVREAIKAPPVATHKIPEAPADPSGTLPPSPATSPETLQEPPSKTAAPPPVAAKAADSVVPLPKEAAAPAESPPRRTGASPDSVPKAAAATPTLPAPSPVSQMPRKSETMVPIAARPEPRPPQSTKTASDKAIPPESPLPRARTVKQPPPPATIAAKAATMAAVIDPPAAKREPPRGIMAPKVTGDIKLTVHGSVIPAIHITFQDFATSRRHRPLSRAESRRETGVAPLVTTQEGVHEFVVPQTHAGIYTITATARGTAASATFLLKLFEGRTREASRKIGTIKVADKTVVVKLLMPDGIVWDDDTAFTGSLENSDSITKFNSDTGLTWKEYK